MMRAILRSRMTGVIAGLMILMLPGEPLVAALQQQKGVEYAKQVKEAEKKYLDGDFDSSIKILETSLRSSDFPQDLKKSAYELLAQNYLAKSYLEQARSAIKNLLTLVPTYSPPADNPPFAAEVEKVRQEMKGTPPQEPAAKVEESAWYESPWVWVGGGILIVGVVVLISLPPPDDEEEPLPGPPGMP